MTQKSRRQRHQQSLCLPKELASQERAIRQFLADRADPTKWGTIDHERFEFLSVSDSDLLGSPCTHVEVPRAVFVAMKEQHRQLIARLRVKKLAQQ